MEQEIKNFLNEHQLSNHHVIFCLRDGTAVWSNFQGNSKSNIELIALTIGAISATEQIAKILVRDQSEDFLMSFASSGNGVFAIPGLSKDRVELYIIVIFRNVINPGQIKLKLKKLMDFCSENYVLKKEHGKALFENITDDEIEQMFLSCKV